MSPDTIVQKKHVTAAAAHLSDTFSTCGGLRLPLLDRSWFYQLPQRRRDRQICSRCWLCLGCRGWSGIELLGVTATLVEGMDVINTNNHLGWKDFHEDFSWRIVYSWWHYNGIIICVDFLGKRKTTEIYGSDPIKEPVQLSVLQNGNKKTWDECQSLDCLV